MTKNPIYTNELFAFALINTLDTIKVKLKFMLEDRLYSNNKEAILNKKERTVKDLFVKLSELDTIKGTALWTIARAICGSGELPRHYGIILNGRRIGLESNELLLNNNDELLIIPILTGG